MKEKSINLIIGDKKYQIVSDDDDLPQMRSGLKSSIFNLIKTPIERNNFESKMVRLFQTLIKFKPIIVLELNHWCLNAFPRITIPDFFDDLQSIFSILYAVEGNCYADIYNERDRYKITYNHIINFKFSNIAAAFDRERLDIFLENYHRNIS